MRVPSHRRDGRAWVSVVVPHHFACFQLVEGAAIRALGLAGFGHVQVHLGVAVPNLHVGLGAGAKHAALGVQVGGQQFNSRVAHGSNLGQPMGVLGVAAVDDVKEGTLDFLGDRATAADVVALAQLNPVEFANWRHFGSGAREEGLVGDVNLVAGDALLHDLQTQIFGDVEHRVAGDAVQGTGRQVWRVDHAIFDHKNVFYSTKVN